MPAPKNDDILIDIQTLAGVRETLTSNNGAAKLIEKIDEHILTLLNQLSFPNESKTS